MVCGTDVSAIPAVGPSSNFPAPLFPPPTPAKTSSKTIWLVVGAILVIVAIPVLAIVAAIAVPTIISKQMSANEAAAVQSLQKLNHALTVYHDTYQHGYPTDLALLGPRASGEPNEFGAALVDSTQTLPEQSGYRFSYDARALDVAGHATAFVLYVDPVSNFQGERHFYLDQRGIIRVSKRVAGSESPPLGPEDTQDKQQ